MLTKLTIVELKFLDQFFKNFHDLNFNKWANRCSPGIAATTWDSNIGKSCIHFTEVLWSPNRRPRQVEVSTSSRRLYDIGSTLLTQLCELISTGLFVEAQNVFEHPVPSAIVGRDTKSCTS